MKTGLTPLFVLGALVVLPFLLGANEKGCGGTTVCVSGEGQQCGGLIENNPCTCATGLVCVLGQIPAEGGTCELPSTGGGGDRCCPATWNLYSCQQQDGSSGLACHNPMLGCASSLICGTGCDFQVIGQCPACDQLSCPQGERWDAIQCKCIPGCQTAADCSGALPMMCQICSDGSYGCARWTCSAGVCLIAFCP
jgi:hypothetical protein